MPTYRVRCPDHGDVDAWAPIKSGAPKVCPYCDHDVVQVLTPPNISAAATPTRRADTAALVEKEKRWDVDGEAYKRLRANGVQPKSIDGAAEFEQRADSPLEFKLGRVIDNKELKEAATQYNDHFPDEVTV